jgi:hypothetical protein
MKTLIIKPKSKEEEDLLTRLLAKMHIEVQLLEEPLSEYTTPEPTDTMHRSEEARAKKVDKTSDSEWEKLSKNQKQAIIDAIAEIDAGQGVPEKEVLDKFRKKYSHA